MTLNNETAKKVLALFPNMPYDTACYCGCWSADTVDFEVGVSDEYRNIIAGVHITITQDFKLLKIKRMSTTWGRYCKNKPLITERIPIHPSGQMPSYRNQKLICGMGDLRHYEYEITKL